MMFVLTRRYNNIVTPIVRISLNVIRPLSSFIFATKRKNGTKTINRYSIGQGRISWRYYSSVNSLKSSDEATTIENKKTKDYIDNMLSNLDPALNIQKSIIQKEIQEAASKIGTYNRYFYIIEYHNSN